MRDKQEVLDKYQELRDRYLKDRKTQFLSRMPINCSHNVRLRVKGKGQLGFCQNPLILAKCGQHKMFLCNEVETAVRCQVFQCKNTEASVEDTFDQILSSPSRCGNDYPKLAMLIWFLQEFDSSDRCAKLGQMIHKLFLAIWGIITFRWW